MIKVLKSGFYSTMQDFGRLGYQHYGVPVSGVMDSYAYKLCNAILGNDENLPVLEMTMTGATLEFKNITSICISGANMSPKINKIAIKNNKLISVRKGDVLSFGTLVDGFRAYLAVLGGFKSEYVMESYSMYQGITKQIIIEKNDALEITSKNSNFENQHALIKVNNDYLHLEDIEVSKGPEFDLLTKDQISMLLNQEFTISKENNRMAYQLNELLPNLIEPIITSPVLPGTVQLTPSGKLIILMRDCQTTGGYPRVLQLTGTSQNKMAQKYSGKTIKFKIDTRF